MPDLPSTEDWSAMLVRLQGQPLDAYGFRFSLLRLISWPSLPQLPEELVPMVARICALLARKPTAASLVPLTLGLSEEEVYPLIEILRLNNHVEAVGGINTQSGSSATDQSLDAGATDKSRETSFIAKIWQRLGIGS